MACAIHCDYVRNFFGNVNAKIEVKCICDAGVFMDIPTVTGAGNVMQVGASWRHRSDRTGGGAGW